MGRGLEAIHGKENSRIQKQQSIMKKQIHEGQGLRAIYEGIETVVHRSKMQVAELESAAREIERLEKRVYDLNVELNQLEKAKKDTPFYELPMVRAFKAGYLEGAEQAISWNEDKHIDVNFTEEINSSGINVIVDIDEEVSLEGRLDMPHEHTDLKCLTLVRNAEEQYWANEGIVKHTERYNADELDAEDVKAEIKHITDIQNKA